MAPTPYADVLKALHDDPLVGKTHDNEMKRDTDSGELKPRHNNRANSRKLLTPEKVAAWHIRELIPARPSSGYHQAPAAQHAPPPDAATGAAVSPPAPAKAPTTQPTRERRLAALDVEIPAVVARKLAEYFGANEYDYAAEIVATARATAEQHDKKITDDDIAGILNWVFGNIRKRKADVAGHRYMLVDGKGDQIGDLGRYFVRSMEKDETVCRYIDGRAQKEKERANAEAARGVGKGECVPIVLPTFQARQYRRKVRSRFAGDRPSFSRRLRRKVARGSPQLGPAGADRNA